MNKKNVTCKKMGKKRNQTITTREIIKVEYLSYILCGTKTEEENNLSGVHKLIPNIPVVAGVLPFRTYLHVL